MNGLWLQSQMTIGLPQLLIRRRVFSALLGHSPCCLPRSGKQNRMLRREDLLREWLSRPQRDPIDLRL